MRRWQEEIAHQVRWRSVQSERLKRGVPLTLLFRRSRRLGRHRLIRHQLEAAGHHLFAGLHAAGQFGAILAGSARPGRAGA